MQKTTKHKIEITFAILVLIAVFVLIWFLLRPTEQGVIDTAPIVQEEEDPITFRVSQPPPGPVEVAPTTVVRTFVERFGSYSNESEFTHIEDIATMSTPALQGRLLSIASEARATAGEEYYGISTYVIAMNEIARDDAAASYTVTTQRKESLNSPANTTTVYQDISISLVKDGTGWLVSDFQWQ